MNINLSENPLPVYLFQNVLLLSYLYHENFYEHTESPNWHCGQSNYLISVNTVNTCEWESTIFNIMTSLKTCMLIYLSY